MDAFDLVNERLGAQRLALLEAEYRQRWREAADAVADGDEAAALRHIRFGLDLEEPLRSSRDAADAHLVSLGQPVTTYGHFSIFGIYLAMKGDVEAVERVIQASERNLNFDLSESQARRHARTKMLREDIEVYEGIRRGVVKSPGIQQVELAKQLGQTTKHLAELVNALVSAGELATASVDGRVCLWAADSPAAPAAEKQRKVVPTFPWYQVEDADPAPSPRTAEEWRRLRDDVQAQIAEAEAARQRDPRAVTFLDFITHGRSAKLADTDGAAIFVDAMGIAIGPGHTHRPTFARLARTQFREARIRIPRVAPRHAWVVLARRTPVGAIFREVPKGTPGSVPVTVMTPQSRNVDSAGLFSGVHTWLAEDEEDLTFQEWEAKEAQADLSGREAFARLVSDLGAVDTELAVEVDARFAVEGTTDGPDSMTIRTTHLSSEPVTDERVGVWVLGPHGAEFASAMRTDPALWGIYTVGGPLRLERYCIIREDGARLVPTTSITPPSSEGSPAVRHSRLTAIPLRTVVALEQDGTREMYTLEQLVHSHGS